MAYLLTAISLLPITGDPLRGIVFGGTVGLLAALLGAALLGAALNALCRAAAGPWPRAPGHSATDQEFHEAA
ncbi:MAG: hypothetical protein H6Q33_3874 [Deltaproteobacteria bacterium]|nr:hypothetical protein [Deltaproteobacteria bacterium]